MKLRFASADKDLFAEDLRNISLRYSRRYGLVPRAKKLLWFKLCFYSVCFCGAYL